MRPGAGQADVQPVAAGLGTMSARAARSRAAIGGQPVAEARLLAPEPAVLRRVVPLVVPFAFDQQAHWILLRGAQSVDRWSNARPAASERRAERHLGRHGAGPIGRAQV